MEGSPFLRRKIGENLWKQLFCPIGRYPPRARRGGGSGGRDGGILGSIRQDKPPKSHKKLIALLWTRTQQKAGKRANRGKELSISGSLSRILIMPILS